MKTFYQFISENRIGDFITNDKIDFNVRDNLVTKAIIDDKLKYSIIYYNSSEHDIIKRIKERTKLRSIKEFNDLMILALKQVQPSRKVKLKKERKYNFHFINNEFNVIFTFFVGKIRPVVKVITVMGKKDFHEDVTTFEINDGIYESVYEIDPYGEEDWENEIDRTEIQNNSFDQLRDTINLIIEHYNEVGDLNLTTQYIERNRVGYDDKQINIYLDGKKIMDICKMPESFDLAISAGTKSYPYGMRHMDYYDYEEHGGIIKRIRRKILELAKIIKNF